MLKSLPINLSNKYTNSSPIQNNYFFCYSPNLYRHLKFHNNIPYITKGTNPSTNRNFWVFEKTDQLKQILDQWSTDKLLIQQK